MLRILVIFTAAFFFSGLSFSTYASVEMYLSPTKFSIESSSLSDAFGIVKVEGEMNSDGLLKWLTAEFKGKRISIPKTLVTKIPPYANAVQLTAARGWNETKGHVLYITFAQGTVLYPIACDKRWTIEVYENGTSRMNDLSLCK